MTEQPHQCAYSEAALAKVAKRENNNKRGYLIVNPLQGKHIPVSPNQSLQLFQQLSAEVSQCYSDETLLVIGFAETATAIGAAVATHLGCWYLQTTREALHGAEPLFFQETHSHATEQKLSRTALEQVLPQVDRILFVEDEITTGNTILNAIHCIQALCSSKTQYSVASILNGMEADRLTHFHSLGIRVHFICHIDNTSFSEKALAYQSDGAFHKMAGTDHKDFTVTDLGEAVMDPRTLVHGTRYAKACEALWTELKPRFAKMSNRVLVLGTEEFMYPALRIAAYAESAFDLDVRFHATTRSPIAVSKHPYYPLQQRYELISFYDAQRTTFLYNLARYDHVVVMTDATAPTAEGVATLLACLEKHGNQDIHIIRWCNHEN